MPADPVEVDLVAGEEEQEAQAEAREEVEEVARVGQPEQRGADDDPEHDLHDHPRQRHPPCGQPRQKRGDRRHGDDGEEGAAVDVDHEPGAARGGAPSGPSATMPSNVSAARDSGPVRHHALPSTRSFRARIWLASAMWVPVMAANVVAIALGLGLPGIDDGLRDFDVLPVGLSSVQQILGALAGGMITFTGIVFSAVFVAAQIQTSSYSPRLAARLRRDRIIILGLALPTATASYSLFALASLGGQRHEDAALTVLVALGLTFATFAGFVALVQRAFDSTQIGGILRGLMRRALRVSADVHPPRP